MFVGSRVLSSSPSWCGIRSWLPLKPVLALRIKRPPTCIPSPAMQHKNGRNITHVSAGHTEAAKDAPNIPNGEDFAWFACGCWLVAGAFLPSLLTCCFYKQILAAEPLKRLTVFLLTDVLFAATSYILMLEGDRFGRERNPGINLVRFPGPWIELSGNRRLPKGFKQYLLAMPASVGLFMPLALSLGSFFWGDDRLLQATCLVPYIGTLLSQIWMEGHFTKQGAYMWPMVPIVHMYYRMTQLARGFALNAALSGPSHIFIVLALLAFVWVFNIAAVIVWMPWLYRWQYQPTKE